MKKLVFTPNFLVPDELPRTIKLLDELDGLHFKKEVSLVEATSYLQAMPSSLLKKVVLHTHQELATRFAVRGIHLSEVQRLSGITGGISTSCHKLQDLVESSKKFEYVFFSPILPSISKQDYSPIYTLSEISNLIKENNLQNIIALGGITPDKETLLKELGFAGAAYLGYYWH